MSVQGWWVGNRHSSGGVKGVVGSRGGGGLDEVGSRGGGVKGNVVQG